MTNRLKQIEKVINNMSDDKFSELLNDLGIKEEQWVPEYGDMYWNITHIGTVDREKWFDSTYDNHRLLMNNVFKTEDEAIAQRYFDIEKAKLIKEIEDSSGVIDWENEKQSKYFLSYEVIDEELYISRCWVYRNQGTTHTTNKEFLENLIRNEPERVKRYLFGIGE